MHIKLLMWIIYYRVLNYEPYRFSQLSDDFTCTQKDWRIAWTNLLNLGIVSGYGIALNTNKLDVLYIIENM